MTNSATQNLDIYSQLFRAIPGNSSLQSRLTQQPFKEQFAIDSLAITAKTRTEDYLRLEHDVVSYLRRYRSPYAGKTAANDIETQFHSVLSYLEVLQRASEADMNRITELKKALLAVFMEKVPETAGFFIAEFPDLVLLSRILYEQSLGRKISKCIT